MNIDRTQHRMPMPAMRDANAVLTTVSQEVHISLSLNGGNMFSHQSI